MTNRVHAAIDLVQAPGRRRSLDLISRIAKIHQLPD